MARAHRWLAALLCAGAALGAHADSVTLTGTIGNRAILIINGGAPRTVAPGQSVDGVRLVSTRDQQAVVEVAGQRLTLSMDSPVSVSGGASGGGGGGGVGTRIVLPAGSGGHFVTQGAINGRAVTFMVDTGATSIGLSAADAQRIGLSYENGQQIRMNTANGVSVGWRVQLDSVRVGDVEVRNVDAVVSPQSMPFILLGNSFISRFSMRRDADQMVLEKRY